MRQLWFRKHAGYIDLYAMRQRSDARGNLDQSSARVAEPREYANPQGASSDLEQAVESESFRTAT